MKPKASEYVLGIDLGTTNSSVAIYKKGQMQVIPMEGNLSMPSAVRFKNRKKDSVVVGKQAKQYEIIKQDTDYQKSNRSKHIHHQ